MTEFKEALAELGYVALNNVSKVTYERLRIEAKRGGADMRHVLRLDDEAFMVHADGVDRDKFLATAVKRKWRPVVYVYSDIEKKYNAIFEARLAPLKRVRKETAK